MTGDFERYLNESIRSAQSRKANAGGHGEFTRYAARVRTLEEVRSAFESYDTNSVPLSAVIREIRIMVEDPPSECRGDPIQISECTCDRVIERLQERFE